MLATGGGVPVIILSPRRRRSRPPDRSRKTTQSTFGSRQPSSGSPPASPASPSSCGSAAGTTSRTPSSIARMRKITDLDPPRTTSTSSAAARRTPACPRLAFPLWHATGAAIVWLSGSRRRSCSATGRRPDPVRRRRGLQRRALDVQLPRGQASARASATSALRLPDRRRLLQPDLLPGLHLHLPVLAADHRAAPSPTCGKEAASRS